MSRESFGGFPDPSGKLASCDATTTWQSDFIARRENLHIQKESVRSRLRETPLLTRLTEERSPANERTKVNN